MDATADELAGLVDLFGGLTRTELERACSEVAYRTDGSSVETPTLEAAIESARSSFALVRYERAVPPAAGDEGTAPDDNGDGVSTEPLLVAGPTAFPSPPDHAEDLPHILDVEPRTIDRERLGERTRDRFARAADEALESGSNDRIRHLLDVSYDLEAWAPIDCTSERARLDDALE
ncbi:DUF7109 family protein [Natrialbaceae archaeon AArc-T1-2]|uniref:DUF7109 family protein n=1 Tax=Natrialbaceae archaeon AArc-T1-2 TaxID=3053904 RepID=UPI00255B18FE|nr:hypothetical protein [Natrialbaceae archaeon AArc-T1-2]WIV66895.1 hypothetical protein QQ977_14575 [Natrialbaceae archaeon AArc-T1-2]